MEELLDRISSHELSEWMAYYEIAPWGDVRADHRHGILCAELWQIGTHGKGKASPADFIPNYMPTPTAAKLSPAKRLELKFAAHAAACAGNRKPK